MTIEMEMEMEMALNYSESHLEGNNKIEIETDSDIRYEIKLERQISGRTIKNNHLGGKIKKETEGETDIWKKKADKTETIRNTTSPVHSQRCVPTADYSLTR